MPLMSLKQFTMAANGVVGALPPKLLKNLNGGIIVEPSVKEDGDYVVMGEYIEDPGLGSMVVLYYGSFREMLGNAPLDEWREEIEETVIHELRHHIESLAGVDDLSVEEDLELRRDTSL